MSLGTTLLFVVLLTTLAFALSSLSWTHLSLMSRSSNEQAARNLARSVVARAIDRILDDPAYGTDPQGLVLESSFESLPLPSRGYLTFDPNLAQQAGIAYCTNNLQGTASVKGASGAVPAATSHLVGRGRHGGAEVVVEAYLHIPPFPYAIASSGSIRSGGGLLVAGLDQPIDGSILNLQPEDLLTADMASNASSDQAIWLGGQSTIRGDLQATGQVVFEAGAEVAVLGEVRSHSDPIDLPELSFEDYDPRARGVPYQSLNSGYYNESPTSISGATVREGPLEVDGGLRLEGGVLLVEGDLTVRGTLDGEGILMVEGDVKVEGGTELRGGNDLALMAKGNVFLQGSGSQGSYFQGLVYTGGGLEADSISVVGTLIARGEEQVSLNDVRLLLPQDGGRVEVTTGAGSVPVGSVGQWPQEIPDKAAVYAASAHLHIDNGEVFSVSDSAQDWAGTSQLARVAETISGTYAFNGTRYPTLEEAAAAVLVDLAQNQGWPVRPGSSVEPDLVEHIRAELEHKREAQDYHPFFMRKWGHLVRHQAQGAPGEATVYTVDPSQFLKFQDRVRLLYWKE